jgi:hypothetical protein
MTFQVPHSYDYAAKLRRKQAEDIHNHENSNVCDVRKVEARYKICKRLKHGGGQAYDCSSDKVAVVT